MSSDGHEGEAVLRTAVRVVMEPALRLTQGDAYPWSEQTRSCPVIRDRGHPTTTDRTSVGLFATGATSGTSGVIPDKKPAEAPKWRFSSCPSLRA